MTHNKCTATVARHLTSLQAEQKARARERGEAGQPPHGDTGSWFLVGYWGGVSNTAVLTEVWLSHTWIRCLHVFAMQHIREADSRWGTAGEALVSEPRPLSGKRASRLVWLPSSLPHRASSGAWRASRPVRKARVLADGVAVWRG